MSNRPIIAQAGPPGGMETDSDEEGDWESDDGVGDSSDHIPDLQPPEADIDGFTTVKGRHSKHR